MDPALRRAAGDAIGFMPEEEGLALYEAGLLGASAGPLLEIGSFCGKSTIYLGAAARAGGSILYSVDHHRGSEEHQLGEEHHDPRLVDESGRVDTLPEWRRTVASAGLDDAVVGVLGRSEQIAAWWDTGLGLVFIDGGHSEEAATADYEGWALQVRRSGLLVIHDVFPDPVEGGRPPYLVFRRALRSGAFVERSACGSLRVLQRIGDGL